MSLVHNRKIRHSQQSKKIQIWFEKQMCLATLNRVVLRYPQLLFPSCLPFP